MIRPTIGRVVWYRPGRSERRLTLIDVRPVPAIIVFVHADDCVNVAGFDHIGVPFAAQQVQLLQEGGAAFEGSSYCEWMPFQRGQSVSADAVVQRLAMVEGALGMEGPEQTRASFESRLFRVEAYIDRIEAAARTLNQSMAAGALSALHVAAEVSSRAR